jgi:hypothetical protein
MTRFIAIATVLTVALAACGEEDEPSTTSARATATPAAGGPERYCALTREMDAAGTRFFARLEAKENATAADFEAAERRFVERFAPQFEEIERAAPDAIRPDVHILLAGQRARAGLGSAVSEAEASAAEKRVLRFERRRCE